MREIPWATFCWKRENLFSTVHHLKTKEWLHVLYNQVFCNALVLYDKWNQELKQTNGAECRRTVRRWLVHITYQTTVFSRWMGGKMVFKLYSKTGNILETIRRFQRQFPNINVHYCQRSCSNLNHTGQTYFNCPLLFVCLVSSDSEIAFGTFWLISEHYWFLYTLKP